MWTAQHIVATSLVALSSLTGAALFLNRAPILRAVERAYPDTPAASAAHMALDEAREVRRLLRSGRRFAVDLDTCPFDDEGWDPDADPLGSLKCGETYLVRLNANLNQWEAYGPNEPDMTPDVYDPNRTAGGTASDNRNEFSIWGVPFFFDAESRAYSTDVQVGHVRPASPQEMASEEDRVRRAKDRAALQALLAAGEPFHAILDACPFDDTGWAGPNDPLGVIACGETYDIRLDISTNAWIASGPVESADPLEELGPLRTHASSATGTAVDAFLIWGSSFSFDGDHNITLDRVPIGRLAPFSEADKTTVILQQQEAAQYEQLKARLSSGEPFHAILDACPFDDTGWDGPNDPLGVIACGETYDIQLDISANAWIASGPAESAAPPEALGPVRTNVSSAAGFTADSFLIWGSNFGFDSDRKIILDRVPIGRLEPFSEADKLAVSRQQQKAVQYSQLKSRLWSGEPFHVALDICPFDDAGWQGDSDPLGVIKCGEVYDIAFLPETNAWRAAGPQEPNPDNPQGIYKSSDTIAEDEAGESIEIWGAWFKFDGQSHILLDDKPIGHLESYDNAELTAFRDARIDEIRHDALKQRLRSGQKFYVDLNGCPFSDEGWQGPDDPLGKVMCGATYELQFLPAENAWLGAGPPEPASRPAGEIPDEAHVSSAAKVSDNTFLIWDAEFTFEGDQRVIFEGVPVGKIRMLSPFELPAEILERIATARPERLKLRLRSGRPFLVTFDDCPSGPEAANDPLLPDDIRCGETYAAQYRTDSNSRRRTSARKAGTGPEPAFARASNSPTESGAADRLDVWGVPLGFDVDNRVLLDGKPVGRVYTSPLVKLGYHLKPTLDRARAHTMQALRSGAPFDVVITSCPVASSDRVGDENPGVIACGKPYQVKYDTYTRKWTATGLDQKSGSVRSATFAASQPNAFSLWGAEFPLDRDLIVRDADRNAIGAIRLTAPAP